MWPWEHAAVGYLVYSIYVHLRHRRSPTGPAAGALAFGALFPDLVDKPLGWTFGVLASGTSFAHSLLVAPLLVGLGWLLARYARREAIGTAFGTGYLLHLPGDLLYPLLFGGPIEVESFLWPLFVTDPSRGPGFLANLVFYLSRYVEFLASSEGAAYVAFEVVLLGGAAGLWLYDGSPGTGIVRHIRLHATY